MRAEAHEREVQRRRRRRRGRARRRCATGGAGCAAATTVERSSTKAPIGERRSPRVVVGQASPRPPRPCPPRATGSSGRAAGGPDRPPGAPNAARPAASPSVARSVVKNASTFHRTSSSRRASSAVWYPKRMLSSGALTRVHPAHDVHAHALGRLVELDGVAPALVHGTAVLAEERGVAEDRLEGRLAAQHRAHRQHRVEPVAELARERLGDEVGREPLLPVARVGRGSGAC